MCTYYTGSGYTFWQFRVADPEKALALSGNHGRGGLGLPGTKKALLPVAAPCPDVVSVIQHIPEAQIFERSIVGRYQLPTPWISKGGRVALVGDSAHGMHPNIGRGANTGFESAAAIVQAMTTTLQQTRGGDEQDMVDWKVAFASYERARRPRAELVQRFANMMGVCQAVGLMPISWEQIEAMLHWIRKYDPTVDPPSDVVEAVEKFEPCDYPGVSLLW